MATIYGNNSSTNNQYYRLWMEVIEGAYNVENNTSPVTVKLYMQRTTGSYANNGGSYNGSIKVGNQTKTYSGTLPYPSAFNEGQSRLYATVTFDAIEHEPDGSKTVTVTATYSASFSPTSGSLSGNVTLATIPRASKINTETTQWVSSTIDDGFTIGITQYSSSFYQKLVVKYLNVSTETQTILKTINNVTDGSAITFTSSELDTIYGASVPAQRGTIYLELYTYSDDELTTQIGDASIVYITEPLTLVAPTFTDFNYADTNTNATTGTTRLTKDNQTIIKGYSTLTVTVPTSLKAVANTRQTLMSHYIVEGETLLYSSDNDVSMAFTKYSKDNISVYAVDERNTSSAVINKSFVTSNKYIDYTNVFKDDNQSYSRSDGGVGEFVTLNFSGTWWGNKKFGAASDAVTNSLTAKYQYKISGAQNWSTPAQITLTLGKAQSSDAYYTTFSFNDIVNGDLPSHGFDVSQSYDIMVIVSDELSSVTYNFSIHSGEPAIALYKNRAALGAKYDETLGGTQLWGDTYLNGDLLEIPEQPTLADLNIYSTTETIIGYLDDGNVIVPIYRIYLTGTTPSSAAPAMLVSNADRLIASNICVIRNSNSQHHPLSASMCGNSDHAYPLFLNESEHNLRLYITNSQYQNRPYYGWIEYTKTTN